MVTIIVESQRDNSNENEYMFIIKNFNNLYL